MRQAAWRQARHGALVGKPRGAKARRCGQEAKESGDSPMKEFLAILAITFIVTAIATYLLWPRDRS